MTGLFSFCMKGERYERIIYSITHDIFPCYSGL